MKVFFVVAIIATVASYGSGAVVNSVNYDCSWRPNGNYLHPSDCTKFITCSNRSPYEMNCATCNVDPVRCPRGRLVFSQSQNKCLWADETPCELGESPTTTEDPGTTTTEDQQTTTSEDPGTTTTEDPETTTTEDQVTKTTEEPGTTNAPPPGSGTPPPKPGDKCDPLDCKLVGYCQNYLQCSDEGKWVAKNCSNLLWNPRDAINSSKPHVHGGTCDLYKNIPADVLTDYETDDKCLACFFKALGDCNNVYEYQERGNFYRKVDRLTCPIGLVFDGGAETCKRCEDVKLANGKSCTSAGSGPCARGSE